MENKELRQNIAFEKMQKEKEDANMRYIAQRIDDLYYNQIDQDEEMPDELDHHMLEFCRKLDAQKEREQKKKKIYVWVRRCAVFLLCFVIISGISISSVDAWKVRFTNWIFNVEEDHVEISPTNISQLNGWHNYYFFSEIPEGYELENTEDWGSEKELFFTNDEKLLVLAQYDASSKIFFDTDTSEYKELTIGGKPAIYHENEEGCSKSILLLEGEWTVDINSRGDKDLTYDTMIELAENLIFIK